MPTPVRRFNPPPGWPVPPAGWTPPAGWKPDPSWPPAPPHWDFWVVVETAPKSRRRLTGARIGIGVGSLLIIGPCAAIGWGGLLVGVALVLTVLGLVALVRGRLRSAWLPNRPSAAGVLAVAVLTFIAGVILSGPAPSVTAAGPQATPSPVSSAERTPSSTPTPTVTPTSTPPTPIATPAPTPSATRTPTPTATATPLPSARPAQRGTALAAVALLTIKGRAPMTGYDRTRYGTAWADIDRNGCDTRNDILRRDLASVTVKAGTNGCLVLAGVLHDPYTGTTIDFVRGVATSWHVQIDHVVALGDSWQKGAQQWSAAKRERFANDPLNLLAVDGSSNEAKGDGDTATWLPPNKPYRCAYVARQVAVKRAYGLWVTQAERDAMQRVLRTCPSQPLPTEHTSRQYITGHARVRSVPEPTTTPTRTHQHEPAPAGGSDADPGSTGEDPRYSTCKEAIEHGLGPYYRGRDVEYNWYRDADSDGVVCER